MKGFVEEVGPRGYWDVMRISCSRKIQPRTMGIKCQECSVRKNLLSLCSFMLIKLSRSADWLLLGIHAAEILMFGGNL